MPKSYADAGVNVEAGYETVSLIKDMAAGTFDKNVLSGLGSFGGFYALADAANMKEPTLISGTDGVGTKLRIAMVMDKHDTVGIDCVAMCVNDIACHGAKPLFFLDYLAVGKLVPERAAALVKGVSEGCKQAGCALIGGETAEMPGFYAEDDYDMAGFAVGLVDKDKIINGEAIKSGDILIGLQSSGVHSNGFSLVRKVCPITPEGLNTYHERLGETLGEALLRPTRIYVNAVQAAMAAGSIHGIAHITGGGFIENVPRIIPDGLCAEINLGTWEEPPVFALLEEWGELDRTEMYNIFNMGIGLVLAVDPEDASDILSALSEAGETACVIGGIVEGPEKVALK
ncbi:MAG: phosphoribosylformylglycinamidine cyclo-ligase [Clostridia bacterium]|nr:phosphoribosylformylglycinamidine cyclo-ligase [Clostridia bacterium]